MNNAQVSEILAQMADLLEMKGEQRFKVVAYQKAARAIGHLSRDLREFAEEGELEQIPGIGKSIAAKIQELVETGQLRQYEELRAEMPEGVLRIANIPGIGPKSAYLICQELGVSTVEGLEKAILQGRLETLPRMGKKTGENILQHIHSFTSRDGRIPLGKALPIAEAVCASIRPYVKNVTAGGSLRRLEETVGDIDILGTSDDPKAALTPSSTCPSSHGSWPMAPQRPLGSSTMKSRWTFASWSMTRTETFYSTSPVAKRQRPPQRAGS